MLITRAGVGRFENNSVHSSMGGAALGIYSKVSGKFDKCIFVNNRAVNAGSGAVHISSGSDPVFTNSR